LCFFDEEDTSFFLLYCSTVKEKYWKTIHVENESALSLESFSLKKKPSIFGIEAR